TDRDIVIRALANGLDIDTPVVDIMTTEIISTSPESTVKDASRKMMINQVKRLPVLDENNLVGVISLRDIVINDCDIEITKVLDGIYQDTDTAGNIDFNSADVDDFRL
ncbi:MAG TPA: CBS domain-containing protein, partial [Tenericutes bacterium]|nr:CBS domain-containing protein [Mycoplasmatota bacterium]